MADPGRHGLRGVAQQVGEDLDQAVRLGGHGQVGRDVDGDRDPVRLHDLANQVERAPDAGQHQHRLQLRAPGP